MVIYAFMLMLVGLAAAAQPRLPQDLAMWSYFANYSATEVYERYGGLDGRFWDRCVAALFLPVVGEVPRNTVKRCVNEVTCMPSVLPTPIHVKTWRACASLAVACVCGSHQRSFVHRTGTQ